MKILITGGDGFVAGHLNLQDHEVLSIDREWNIQDYKKLAVGVGSFNPDIIIHLAANTSSVYAERCPIDDFKTNSLGTLNVLELAREKGASVIYLATHKSAKDDTGARSPYGLSKWVAHELCEEWRISYKVDVIINIVSNLYGPGGDKFWINKFMSLVSKNQPVPLYGEGLSVRDMLWIDDLTALIEDQVNNFDKYKNKTWEVGGGKKNSICPKVLLKLLDYDNVVKYPELKGDNSSLISDNFKVMSVNGWEPKVGIYEGIDILKKEYGKK